MKEVRLMRVPFANQVLFSQLRVQAYVADRLQANVTDMEKTIQVTSKLWLSVKTDDQVDKHVFLQHTYLVQSHSSHRAHVLFGCYVVLHIAPLRPADRSSSVRTMQCNEITIHWDRHCMHQAGEHNLSDWTIDVATLIGAGTQGTLRKCCMRFGGCAST